MQRKRFQKRPPRITLRDVFSSVSDVDKRLDTQENMLRTVVNHMTHMEQRLSARLDKHDEMFVIQGTLIASNTVSMNDLRETLINRIDALEEDLTAVMTDTIVIRRHVGMPISEEV